MRTASASTPKAHIARSNTVGLAVSGCVPAGPEVEVVVPSSTPGTELAGDTIPHLPQDTQFSNVGSFGNRVRTTLFRLGAKHRTVGRSSNDTWQGIGDVAYEVDNSELVKRGVILLDTQSEDDLISTRFARKFLVDLDAANPKPYALTVTGHTVYSVGTMSARWYTEKKRSRLSFRSRGPILWRFIEAEFRIIDSDQFDVIIGKRTINDHMLLERTSLVAPFRELIPPSKDNEEQEKAARERREQAAKRRDQHEQGGGSGRN